MRNLLCTVSVLLFSFQMLAAEKETTTLKTSIKGDALSINSQKTELGASQWKDPEQSWRTVAALIKSALPPANKEGMRPDVTLAVELDGEAKWGAAKALFMAASSLGVQKAKVGMPDEADSITLAMPGANSEEGSVVRFPISVNKDGKVKTENGGRKISCTAAVMKGLIKQLPKATIYVKPANEMPAAKAIKVIDELKNTAQAAAVAYMPVVEVTVEEKEERKKTKDAIDRAFGGGALGG